MPLSTSFRACLLFFSVGIFALSPAQVRSEAFRADIVVYGSTASAIAAALESHRLGHKVILVSPDKHLGGLSSGGLGWTDTGKKEVIGGIAREFYHRVWQHYQSPEAWKFQSKEKYGNQGQGNPAIDGALRTMWIFEPHVAESIFESWITSASIPILREAKLDRSETGTSVKDRRIVSIKTLRGDIVYGKVFIDATYEGDLMAAAGVSYNIGRESKDTYDEKWNGVQTGVLHHRHHFGIFTTGVSPYRIPGDPNSGLLPHISPEPPGEYGSADSRVQAYCFRMCLTNNPQNRIPFPKPLGYDPNEYELLRRVLDLGWREGFEKFDPIPNQKTDTNNHGPFSTDHIGANYDYPDANYELRQRIVDEHKRYQQGLMYFLANDPGVPAEVRTLFANWGLAADEFIDNDNWPHQLYIREARRMVGAFVMTEKEILKSSPVTDPIGMGSYTIDSHNVQRYVTPDGFVQNEGDIGVSTFGPYPISMRSILPKSDECENLIVPVCLSSSHIAFGSIRMEPVFMILGHSAATIASLSVDASIAVQSVDYSKVKAQLIRDGQILEFSEGLPSVSQPMKLDGIVVDNTEAIVTGEWRSSRSVSPFVGTDYLHDNNDKTQVCKIQFRTHVPVAGHYLVSLSYNHHSNRCRSVPVTILHKEGRTERQIDQTKPAQAAGWQPVGVYYFSPDSPCEVSISSEGTDGYVVCDAVQWMAQP